jgi:hypothetical protein
MYLRLLLPLSCPLVLSACVYTVYRDWAGGPPAASQSDRPGLLQAALTDCVTENDPDYLAEVKAGGHYPPSGWFVSEKGPQAVEVCMQSKSWFTIPVILFP